jgi:hypothetical protein
VSIARQHEDGTYGTFDPVDADHLSEDLRVRCVEAIEPYRAEPGTAPNSRVIETSGQVNRERSNPSAPKLTMSQVILTSVD